MIVLNVNQLNRSSLSGDQKSAISYMVDSVNSGDENALPKLKQVLRLYRIENIIEEVPEESREKLKGGLEEESVEAPVLSSDKFYGGVAPEIDNHKWFYNPDTVQWVGFPSNREFSDCLPEELVYYSRESLPDWEVYVPLDYHREERQDYKYAPVHTPMGRQNGVRARMTPRLSREVGMGGMRK